MNEVLYSKVMNLKFNQYMKSKFNFGANFLFNNDNSNPMVEVAVRNPAAPIIISQGKLLVPYRFEGQLVGVAVVPKITSYLPADIESIRVGILSYLGHLSWNADFDYQNLLSFEDSPADGIIWLFA